LEERSHPFLSEQTQGAGRESLFARLAVPDSGIAGLQEFRFCFLKMPTWQTGRIRP